MSDSKELRDIIAHRAHRFFARYPKMIVAGLTLLTVLPFVFLVLLFVTQEKIAMLTSWILSIILIDAYLIVVEYARETYAMQLGVSAMSADEFRNVMLNGYAWRRFHGHGRHEATMGSIRISAKPLNDSHCSAIRPPSRLRTPHSSSSPVSLGSLGKEAHDEAYLENIRT